jgi:hypothetical protein
MFCEILKHCTKIHVSKGDSFGNVVPVFLEMTWDAVIHPSKVGLPRCMLVCTYKIHNLPINPIFLAVLFTCLFMYPEMVR